MIITNIIDNTSISSSIIIIHSYGLPPMDTTSSRFPNTNGFALGPYGSWTYVYMYTYSYHAIMYILSGPRKRWESFWIASVGHTPAQRKRNRTVDGNAPETLTETLRKRGENADGNVVETLTRTRINATLRLASHLALRCVVICDTSASSFRKRRLGGPNPRPHVDRRGRNHFAKTGFAWDLLGRPWPKTNRKHMLREFLGYSRLASTCPTEAQRKR